MTSQTSRQARHLKSLLSAGGVCTDVSPVLVLWGRGITGAPAATIDAVLVGLGSHIDAWFSQVPLLPLADEQVRLARRAVERFKAGEGVRKPKPAPNILEEKTAGSRLGHRGLPAPRRQPEQISIGHR